MKCKHNWVQIITAVHWCSVCGMLKQRILYNKRCERSYAGHLIIHYDERWKYIKPRTGKNNGLLRTTDKATKSA